MSAVKPKASQGIVKSILDDHVSESEMDSLLADRRGEIDAKLIEAYEDKARGDFAPLEPLHALLRDARERAKTGR
jgi:hypothetical protein